MLKELYVLRNGTPLFYHSEFSNSNKLSDEDVNKSILSSGLLSAISLFSEEARSSELKSFNSENEIFIFTKLNQYDADMIGVFDADTPINLGNLILQKIKTEILQANIIEADTDIVSYENKEFSAKIPEFVNAVTNPEVQADYYQSMLNKLKAIFLGFSAEIETKEVVWKFARPLPLFNESLVDDSFLTFKVANNFLNKTGLGSEISLLAISNDTKRSVFFNNQFQLVSLSSTLEKEKAMIDTVMKMGSVRGIQEMYPEFYNPDPTSKYKFFNNQLNCITGKKILEESSKVFIMTFLNNAGKLFESIHQKKRLEILLVYKVENDFQHIRMSFDDPSMNCAIEIFN